MILQPTQMQPGPRHPQNGHPQDAFRHVFRLPSIKCIYHQMLTANLDP